jgi:hypothetical protein
MNKHIKNCILTAILNCIFFYASSQVYTITTGLPNNILSGSGTNITGLSDDNFVGPFNFGSGFSFPFFNTSQTQFYLSANGYITFGGGSGSTGVGTIPNTSTPNNFIAFAATDQYPGASSSPIINYFITGTSPNRICVINYQNVRHYSNSGLITSVQVQLFESSGKIEIHNILNTSGGYTRSIGIENSTGSAGFSPSGMNGTTNISVSNTMIRFSTCSSPPVPVISPSTVSTLCTSNPSVSLSATCQVGVLVWSTGASTSSITVSPTSTTTYSAICVDNGCQSSSNILVPVLQVPTVSPNGTNYICTGNNVTLTASSSLAGVSFQWYKDGSSVASATTNSITVNSTGSYSVNVSKDGCTESSTNVNIIENTTVPDPPVINPSTIFTCINSPTPLTATGCTGTVVWSNGSTGSSISVSINSKGTYSALCRVNGCNSISSNVVNVNIATVSISAPNGTSFCPSNTIPLQSTTNVTGSFTYQWLLNGNPISGATAATYNAGLAGNISLRITLPNNCIITSSFLTTYETQSIVPTIAICDGSSSTSPLTRVWDKTFEANNTDTFQDLIKTADNGFLIIGSSISGISVDKTTANLGNNDIWVIKVDENGNKLWDKSFGGNSNDIPLKIINTNDGNYIIAGYKPLSSYPSYFSSYWLIKISPTGDVIWQKYYEGSSFKGNDLSDIILLSDGYLIGGSSEANIGNNKSENSRGFYDYWVIKTDFDGNKIWDKTFGGSSGEILNSIVATPDNGFLIGGQSYSPAGFDKSQGRYGDGTDDYWIVKMDANGTKLWDKTFGGSSSDKLKRIINMPDGGYLLAGQSNSPAGSDKSQNSKGDNDYWVIKIDANGNKLWDKNYGGNSNDYLTNVLNVTDGLIFTGYSYSDISGDVSQARKGAFDFWLIKTDFNGNKVWDKNLGGTYNDNHSQIISLDGNNFMFGGDNAGPYGDITNKQFPTSNDYWIAKLKLCNPLSSPAIVNSGTPIELVASGCPGLMTWNTGQTTGILNVNPTQSTTYSVSCVSTNNCITQATVQVNVNCSANFTISAQGNNLNPVVCNTSPSVILEATGCNQNILWSDGSTTSSITVSPTSTGTYSATCSGATCQTINKSIQVTYIANPNISASGATTICTGSAVLLTATTNVTGGILQWYLDGNSISGANSLTYSANQTGSYTFKVFKDGCEAVSNAISVIVNSIIPPKPTITANTLFVCGRGNIVNLTASGCSGTVNWGRSTTSNNFWVNTPTGTTASAYIYDKVKYFVSCTENACTSINSDSVEVDYARVNVTATDNIICTGGSVLLTASVYPNSNIVSYLWNESGNIIPNATNSTFNATSVGTYNVRVTYDNNCVIFTGGGNQGVNMTLINYGNLPNPNIIVTDNAKTGVYSKIWDKRLGGNSYETMYDMIKSEDNNSYFLMGVSNQSSSGFNGDKSQIGYSDNNYWIVKTDKFGNKLWDVSYGSFGYEILTKGILMKNKSLLLLGHSDGTGGDKSSLNYYDSQIGTLADGWIIKIDSTGKKVWDKGLGGTGYDSMIDGVKISDNEYIIGGSTSTNNTLNDVSASSRGLSDYWIVKIDSSGNKIWDKRFGGNKYDNLNKMIRTTDGGMILVGTSTSDASGDKTQSAFATDINDIWIVKIDVNGNKLWDKTIGTTYSDSFNDVSITNDNEILVSLNFYSNTSDTQIFKLSPNGTILWQKLFINTFVVFRITPNPKGILLNGSAYTNNGLVLPPVVGSPDGFIVQLDSLGNKLWDRRFGSINGTNLNEIVKTEKGYLLGGFSSSSVSGAKTQPSRGQGDFWMIEVNENQEIPQPASINAGQSINLIANNCPGTITWSGGATGTGALITVSPTVPTTYTATCTAYGCSTSSNISISINCSSNFTITAKDNNGNPIINPSVCTESPSVNLEATGCSGTIAWTHGASGSFISVSPTTNTTYTATCSDVGCTGVTATTTVNTFETPTINAAGPTTFCVGGAVVLNASFTGTGYALQWYKDGSTINQTSNSITVNQSGSYRVLISKNGCSSISNTINVTVNTIIPAAPTYTNNVVYACISTSVQLTANGCPNGIITWSNGATGSSTLISYPSNTNTFTSTCTIGGCVSNNSLPIQIFLAESKILNDPIELVCNGSSVQLNAKSYPNATYQWRKDGGNINGATNISYLANQLGQYTLLTTYYSGCTVDNYQATTLISFNNPITPSIFALNQNSNFAPTKVWDRTFGGNNADTAPNIIPTSDKGFVIIGNSFTFLGGNKKAEGTGSWIVKIDSSGNKQWEKAGAISAVQRAIKLADKGYFVAGSYFNATNFDLRITRLDSLGNIVWTKSINSAENEDVGGLLEASNGDLFLAGTRTIGGNNTEYFLLKMNSSGTQIYDRIYSVSGSETLTGIVPTSDGNVILAGISNSGINGEKQTAQVGANDIWLLKVNTQNSNKIWDKTFGGTANESLRSIITDGTSGFILSSHSDSPLSGDKSETQIGGNDFWVFKIDNDGNKIWDKTLGTTLNDNNPNVIISNDNQLLLFGTNSTSFGTEDFYLMKANKTNGNQIWSKTLTGNQGDWSWSIAQTHDDGIILSGTTLSSIGNDKTAYTFGDFDWWIVKLKNGEPITAPVSINQGQSISLVASNCQGNVTWSNGMSGANITVSPTINTSYIATCNAFGCTSNSTIQVNVNPCSQIVSLTQVDNILTGTSASPIKIKAQETINATNTIGQPPTNANAKYFAGKSIFLNEGFKVEAGSIFEAKISNTPCNE